MSLAEYNFNEIKERISNAYKTEDPVLKKFRDYARQLKNEVKPIRTYSVNAVSFVSSDGGDNRFVFNPGVIELIRIVDSRGNQCALDAIAGNSKASEFQERIKINSSNYVEPLKKLCEDLNMDILELSYLLKGIEEPGKSRGAVRVYRDIVEWAVLYHLMRYFEWGNDTILVRDGLLRTKSFKLTVFPKLDSLMRKAYEYHKNKNVSVSIVGVAKQSAVLSRLSVALELEETFHKSYPCYVQVPKNIEEDCYNFDRTWLDTLESIHTNENDTYRYQSMGKMFLVKFGDRPYDPVWPVDIAAWQVNEADKIIGQLTKDAQPGFPIPDFPMCIQKAHDFARVSNVELEFLQEILLESMTKNLPIHEKEKILRLKYLRENLAKLRYRNA